MNSYHMKEVKNMDLRKLGMKEDLDFHRKVYSIVEQANDLEFRQHVFAYREKITAFKEALKQREKSLITKEVSSLEKRRDRAYRAITSLVSVGIAHFNAQTAEAARQIQHIIRTYGNPARLSHQEKSDVLRQLTEIFAGEGYATALDAIHATEWIEELIAANDAFDKTYLQRREKQTSFVTSSTSAARREADQVYHSLVKVMNVLMNLSPDKEKEQFIEKLNQVIDQTAYRQVTRKKRSVAKKSD